MKKNQRQLNPYERNQLLRYAKKEADFLEKGEMPVEYFTGIVEFKGLKLLVDERVLIPRVETEDLVDLLIESFQAKNNFSYLEVGTGSGAISVSFIKHLEERELMDENMSFLVTDSSKGAVDVAKENCWNNLAEQSFKKIEFFETGLTKKIEDKAFNMIVANLPYIPSVDIQGLDESVRDFEPHLALDGGETGFELIANFLRQISEKNLLKDDGKIFLEVDQSHDRSFIESKFPQFLEKFKINFIKDQFERNRFLIIEELKS